jgi:hypothetical protein
MRIRVLPCLVITALAASTVVAPAADAAVRTSRGGFGTSPVTVTRSPATAPEVTAVRVAHHPKFDRVVIDLRGAAPGYSVRYVRHLHRDPSGLPVNLLGPASLRLVLTPANGHDPSTGHSTLTTAARTKWRLDEVRETAVIGDFEAVFSVGVGVAAKAPFRVQTLHHPTRIVLDVRH